MSWNGNGSVDGLLSTRIVVNSMANNSCAIVGENGLVVGIILTGGEDRRTRARLGDRSFGGEIILGIRSVERT